MLNQLNTALPLDTDRKTYSAPALEKGLDI
jgi:hypothetical protein